MKFVVRTANYMSGYQAIVFRENAHFVLGGSLMHFTMLGRKAEFEQENGFYNI